jgi:DNA-binding response OmpR family regulator/DNA-binding CsgD family transcriptional regulator
MAANQEVRQTQFGGNRSRILVVDDHKANRTKMSAAAQYLGHETCEAADGAAALRELSNGRIDLVLLDIIMPVMDGFEVLAKMKITHGMKNIPVIVVSALEDEMASVVKAIELGAEDILPKDFDPSLFKARLDAGLERKRRYDAEARHWDEANKATEKTHMTSSLYRKVLDTLAASVFVVDGSRRLVLANKAGETMLASGQFIQLQRGRIEGRRVLGKDSALHDAINSTLGEKLKDNARGIGVPLLAHDGESAAAYVLPVAGNDSRATSSPDHCVIFVARRGEEQSMTTEILRTVFDLTVAEARVAMHIAKGHSPQLIAENLDLSIHTVRTHLKRAFSKTSMADQPSLGALVNSLLPPI